MTLAAAAPDAAAEVPGAEKLIRSHGLLFPEDRALIAPKRRRLLRDGAYELKEYEAVSAMVKRIDRVIEIGAGIGYMSTVMAVKLGVRDIHCFEANPMMIPYIRRVHQLNGCTHVTVTNALLGSGEGEANFYVRGDFAASSMEDNLKDKHGGVVRVEKVPVMDANAVFSRIAPTVLVCDIEGAEAHLLPTIDMSCLRLAIVELHPQTIGQQGVQAVFDAMHRAGLTYYPRQSQGKVVAFAKGW